MSPKHTENISVLWRHLCIWIRQDISKNTLKSSVCFGDIWNMIFKNVSQNTLRDIIDQCVKCVECVMENFPKIVQNCNVSSSEMLKMEIFWQFWKTNFNFFKYFPTLKWPKFEYYTFEKIWRSFSRALIRGFHCAFIEPYFSSLVFILLARRNVRESSLKNPIQAFSLFDGGLSSLPVFILFFTVISCSRRLASAVLLVLYDAALIDG